MRKTFIALALMLLSLALAAVELNVDIAPYMQAKNDADYPLMLKPGEPMLPYYPLRVLLPFGQKFDSAEISFEGTSIHTSGLQVRHAQAQQPISIPFSGELTPANPLIYSRDAQYPTQDWEYLGTQYYRGHAIAVLNIYPYKFNPVKGELSAAREVKIKINSTFDLTEAQKQAPFVTNTAATTTELGALVENPDLATSYTAATAYRNNSREINLDTPHTMIIITNAERADWFSDYVDWRNTQGINTGLYIIEDIYSEYDGVDNAEKLRNFIIAAYTGWSSTVAPLEYVILGGDDEIIPQRGVYGQVGSTRDNHMPSDLYFSNLDGNWNADEDQIYGEYSDDVDYLPEVHIGRFPAETYLEFENIFRKTKYYVNYNTFSNNKAIFFGENLNTDPYTWGGDYKDDVEQYLPDTYFYSTQYERDGTYSAASVWNSINSGVNVMNHMGHANETYLMGQGNNTIQQLTNTEYGFLYSQGCYPAAFDQATSGNGECIGEHLAMAYGGVFAFIGNTRYGWYAPGDINGASEYYDRQYFRGLYQEAHPEFGRALTFSRMENLNAAMTSDVMRWCYMEIILFGDPSIGVKLPDPDLPMLSLESYHFDDSQGDNDGNINPGELIRFYPVVSNAEGWAAAQNVSIRVEAVPYGVTHMGQCIMLDTILPGQSSPEDVYVELQLPDTMDYGIFSVKVAVESFHPITQLSTGIQYYDATFEITMFDNRFPWETINAGKSAPIVADMNGNGSPDITFTDVFGGVHMISEDGEEYQLYSHPEDQNINRSNAMGMLGNPASLAMAFSSRSGKLYAMTTDGNILFDYDASSPFLFTPVIADLNGDGSNEVIAGALNGKLYVVNADGSDFPGFPVQLSGTFQSELAVGDLDNDTQAEIICGMNAGMLVVVSSDGSIRESFNHTLDSSLTGSPIVLDNGRIAIASQSTLYLFEPTGDILFEQALDSPVAGGLTAADIDRNGDLDIVLVSVSGKLWVLSQNGYSLPGFPADTEVNFNCPPLIADLDSDNQYEIVLHSYINSIFIYETNGQIMEGFPFGTTYNGATPGTLVDYDQNGYFKLVTGFSNGVLMSNLRKPVSDLTPWITYRGSLGRSGSFAATGFVQLQDHTQNNAPEMRIKNYPNPFNPSTTISFELAKAGAAELSIYNTRGQKVRSLLHGDLDQGNHAVTWDGKDEAGNNLASGLYFYRLTNGGRSITKKMLMLK